MESTEGHTVTESSKLTIQSVDLKSLLSTQHLTVSIWH